MKNRLLLLLPSLIFIFFHFSNEILNIIVYCICIIPLAFLLGEFTSDISTYIGYKKGGIIAATLGNLPELMMGIWSMSFGMIALTKAALIGSIISNMLLVLGISIFSGGLKFREQNFNKLVARTNFNMLLLAISAMVVIASLNSYGHLSEGKIIKVSVIVSGVLIFIYLLGLVFSFYTHSNLFIISEEDEETRIADKKEKYMNFFALIVCAILLFIISERLIENIKIVVEKNNMSQEFLGIILMPILGNVGENVSAIISAIKNKVNLSLEIAIGSSIQISLFVTPLLIIISYCFGMSMHFVFSDFQIVICIIAIAMAYFVFQDGKTYWLEGAILISIYSMISVAYYYMV